jgi:hypothetical protein
MTDLVEKFKASSPTMRRLFLAQMAINYSGAEYQELHAVLSELHRTLGDFENE